MKKCFMLVGPPGVGKSTWITKKSCVIDSGYNLDVSRAQVVSSDNVIEKISSSLNLCYDDVFQNAIKLAEQVATRDAIAYGQQGENIVIDRTNMSVKSRRKWFDLLKPLGYEFHAVVFELPEKSEWQRRLDSRKGKTIPEHVINGMVSSFQFPSEEEGFSTIEPVAA